MKQTYFPHDSNARNDIKLIKVRAKYGYQGFGIYFAIIELLFSENNRLCIEDYKTLAFGLQCDKDILKDIITNFDLFIIEDNCFYSKRLNDTIQQIQSKSTKASLNAKKRWSNDANAMQTQCNGNANAMLLNKSKVNKSKVNKIKERIVAFKNAIQELDVDSKTKKDFFEFWSELNKSETKMRFELEKTWNLKRRVSRWINSKFNKKETGIKFPDYYDIHFAKRIEQDMNARNLYQKHLESIGYVKEINNYDGKIKWIKK